MIAPMNPAPNLALVGPMGAGKSAIGRVLAERLGLRFADLDHEIESGTGASVATIFALLMLVCAPCSRAEALVGTSSGAG